MMYARLQISRSAPPRPPPARRPPSAGGPGRGPLDDLAGRPGFAGGYLMRRPDDAHTAALLTLWDTAGAGGGDGAVETDVVYEVLEEVTGPAATRVPRAAVVLHFDGRRSDEWLAAVRFGHRERIGPAICGVPGFVRALVLWDPGTRSSAVVSLAVSVAALALMEKAVNSTELLPGEDPVLLTGPDRAVIHHVAGQVAANG